MRGRIKRNLARLLLIGIALCFYGMPTSEYPSSMLKLKLEIEKRIRSHAWKVSVIYIDLSKNYTVKINPSYRYNPASVIKLPIVVEAFSQVNKGTISWTDDIELDRDDVLSGSGKLKYKPAGTKRTLYELAELMMVYSDNTATKILIDLLGKDRVNQSFAEMGLTNTTLNTSNLLNAYGYNETTAWDMAYLLKKIVECDTLDKSSCLAILNLMTKQTYRWGIPSGLPKTIKVANKTGSLAKESHDVGVVYYQNEPYVLAIFVSGPGAFIKGKDFVSELSELVYSWKVYVDTKDST